MCPRPREAPTPLSLSAKCCYAGLLALASTFVSATVGIASVGECARCFAGHNRSSAGLIVVRVELDEATGRPRPPQEVRDTDRRLVIAASSAEMEF